MGIAPSLNLQSSSKSKQMSHPKVMALDDSFENSESSASLRVKDDGNRELSFVFENTSNPESAQNEAQYLQQQDKVTKIGLIPLVTSL